jgi:hypothetical protein
MLKLDDKYYRGIGKLPKEIINNKINRDLISKTRKNPAQTNSKANSNPANGTAANTAAVNGNTEGTAAADGDAGNTATTTRVDASADGTAANTAAVNGNTEGTAASNQGRRLTNVAVADVKNRRFNQAAATNTLRSRNVALPDAAKTRKSLDIFLQDIDDAILAEPVNNAQLEDRGYITFGSRLASRIGEKRTSSSDNILTRNGQQNSLGGKKTRRKNKKI